MNTLQSDLQKCRVEGNTLYLPEEQLTDYPAVRKALLNAGAKYKRNTFVFDSEAQPIVDVLLSGESVNIQQEHQAFYTPKEVAESMIDQIYFDNENAIMFEPSAGRGVLIETYIERFQQNFKGVIPRICYCEQQEINRKILETNLGAGKYNALCMEEDFLKLNKLYRFDVIIANPPFTKGQDVLHIMKMYDHLNDGGHLITLCSPSYQHNSTRPYSIFRGWLLEVDHLVRTLPPGSFKESGTNIDVVMIEITKP